MTTFNKLSPAEVERLYYLSEELAESIQAIQKVLRHGYESRNPDLENGPTNREHLEEELGQTMLAIALITAAQDLNENDMLIHGERKAKVLHKWMHHQPFELLDDLKD